VGVGVSATVGIGHLHGVASYLGALVIQTLLPSPGIAPLCSPSHFTPPDSSGIFLAVVPLRVLLLQTG
jgi:hypothetical protein